MQLVALLLAMAGLILTGCFPVSQAQSDEEKEPHFIAGKNHLNALDYEAAIENFEKALEVNPRSSAAHFELGLLFEQSDRDPALALYHFDRYLKLRPDAPNTESVKGRMLACKRAIASTISLGPISEKQRRDLERFSEDLKRLTEENQRLNEEITRLRIVLATAGSSPQAGTQARAGSTVPQANPGTRVESSRTSAPAYRAVRTHTVRSGETFSSIARQYGVKLDALMLANPRVDARRLRPGQSVNIP